MPPAVPQHGREFDAALEVPDDELKVLVMQCLLEVPVSNLQAEEVQNIVKILGLKFGQTYTRENVSTLRYGHLMIMTDQDHDGSHIKGLLINLVHHFWPSLLEIDGFLQEFITPIVKATKGKAERTFFTMPEYEAWKEEGEEGANGNWAIKYYKGLGTSSAKEAKAPDASEESSLAPPPAPEIRSASFRKRASIPTAAASTAKRSTLEAPPLHRSVEPVPHGTPAVTHHTFFSATRRSSAAARCKSRCLAHSRAASSAATPPKSPAPAPPLPTSAPDLLPALCSRLLVAPSGPPPRSLPRFLQREILLSRIEGHPESPVQFCYKNTMFVCSELMRNYYNKRKMHPEITPKHNNITPIAFPNPLQPQTQ